MTNNMDTFSNKGKSSNLYQNNKYLQAHRFKIVNITFFSFFKEVAETQLSRMSLDFRDRRILPLSIA